MFEHVKQHWDLIKIMSAFALAQAAASAGAGKLVARSEVAVVEARMDEHLRPGIIHEESARRITAVADALDAQWRGVDAKAEAAARDAYASRIMLEALLKERGIDVPGDALRSTTRPPGSPESPPRGALGNLQP